MLVKAISNNLKLSMPILLTRLLSIISNVIAMILIARLGELALSAGALIMGIFSVCVLLVMAFSFSVCALIATARGQQDHEAIGKIIRTSLLLNSLLALPFMLIFYHIGHILLLLHQPKAVALLVEQYFHGVLPGYLPMIWASILEQFFIGMGKPRYMVYLSVLGVIIMPLCSSILIFGHYGVPALGMLGAGYAVSLTSCFSLGFLLTLIIKKKWHQEYQLFNWQLPQDKNYFKKLYHLGWPLAVQFGGEFTAYTLISLMMGWVGVIALAAQQVILQFTSVVVMVPTSIAQATAVLVGEANGLNDIKMLKYQVNISLTLVLTLMILIALAYLMMPTALAHIYLDTHNPANAAILALTKIIFAITALSQCFDGIKNVLAGAYRGMHETKIPMRINVLMLWLVSMPLAYILGFVLHEGAIGVRWGFTIGIILAACILMWTWYKGKIPALSKL